MPKFTEVLSGGIVMDHPIWSGPEEVPDSGEKMMLVSIPFYDTISKKRLGIASMNIYMKDLVVRGEGEASIAIMKKRSRVCIPYYGESCFIESKRQHKCLDTNVCESWKAIESSSCSYDLKGE